jgi:3-phosphoshikimate 1-carboxyvinyltransferase
MCADRRRLTCGVARGEVTPPSSKSLTQRYLNLALLAGGPMRIGSPLLSADTMHFHRGLEVLGWTIRATPGAWALEPPNRSVRQAEINCGASGTMLRFLTASLATVPGRWRLIGTERLAARPIAGLVDALRGLGAEIDRLEKGAALPLQILGGTLRGGECELDATPSSQYLSALLMAAVRAPRPVRLTLRGLTSLPYIDLTLAAMARFGVAVEPESAAVFRLSPTSYRPQDVEVETDVSAACYFAAAAALTRGDVLIHGVRRDTNQGDVAFLKLLDEMGAVVRWEEGGVRVQGREALRAVDVDLSAMPDQVPTLAALAPFCVGTTRIHGVAHLRLKESDRLSVMSRELRRLGAVVREGDEELTIEGVWAHREPPEVPVRVRSCDDHRIAMSLALVGLRRRGATLLEPGVVNKSYPAFWDDLDSVVR